MNSFSSLPLSDTSQSNLNNPPVEDNCDNPSFLTKRPLEMTMPEDLHEEVKKSRELDNSDEILESSQVPETPYEDLQEQASPQDIEDPADDQLFDKTSPSIEYSIQDLVLGHIYDVFDANNKWCEAEIVKIDNIQERVYVNYIYWGREYDEWISDIAAKIKPVHTYTYQPNGKIHIGQRVEALDEKNKWYEAFIIAKESDRIQVHFKGFHPKFDLWIDHQDIPRRIRQYGPSRNHRRNVWGLNRSQGAISPISSLVQGSNKSFDDGPRVRYISEDTRKRTIVNASAQFLQYKNSLEQLNYSLVSVNGDGNCLFRAISHQIYGDENYHAIVREKCIDYMESEADFFSQFVIGGRENFHLYLQAKRQNACWGDDPEIEAICELYNRPIEIWAYDPITGAKRLRTFHESQSTQSRASNQSPALAIYNSRAIFHPMIRLSYYGGGHYDSIIDRNHSLNLVHYKPGEIEEINIARSRNLQRQPLGPPSSSSLPSDNLSQPLDRDTVEQISFDSAVRESLRMQSMNDQNDLETCLVLSLQQSGVNFENLPHLPIQNNEINQDIRNLESAIQPSDVLDQNILKSIQESSERDFLEQAIISSLNQEDTDEILLQQTMLESQNEQFGGNLRLQEQFPPQMSSSPKLSILQPRDISAFDPIADRDLQMALELSSEEDVLDLVLKQSLGEGKSESIVPLKTLPSVNPESNRLLNHLTEDEQLQLALAASLGPSTNNFQSTTSSSSAPYSQTNPYPAAFEFQSDQFNLPMEEYDEDLMRAIQESLRQP